MSDEINTPDTGTENVESQAPDTSEDWDYFDPDEDQDTEVAQETAETEDGAEEAEPEPLEAGHDHIVTMPDGTKIPVSELLKGNQRQSDYTRKSQEVATQRKAVEASNAEIQSIITVFGEHLRGLIPPKPPADLAWSNPNAFTAQQAQHEAGKAQAENLLDLALRPKAIQDAMSREAKTDLIASENAALAERFPEITTKQGREKFFSAAAEAATQMGFSMAELGDVTDHRMFALAHYAKLGMAAMNARTATKAKAATAPPVTARRPGQPVGQSRNPDAMKKLSRSGSMRDAMRVDWD